MFIGVIADDLTSAADGGAPFARAGHTVFVGFQGSSAPLRRGADLDAILAAIGTGDGVLWVGSPGLAHALARAHPASGAGLPMVQPGASRPLVLAGSLHPASRAQVEILAAATETPPVRIALTAAGSAGWGVVAERAGAECRRVARRGGPIIVQSTTDVVPGGAAAAASCLAEMARSLATDGLVDGLIATGGDTARPVAGALGACGRRLWGEMEPGVPVGILDCPHPLPVITKAGGFGDQGTLVRFCNALRNPVLPAH